MARGLGRCGMKDDGERNQARDGVLRRGHGQDPADPDAGEAGERRGRMDPWVDRAGRRLRSVESSRSTGLRMHASMGACAAAGTRRRRGALLGKEHGRRERASIPTRSSRDGFGSFGDGWLERRESRRIPRERSGGGRMGMGQPA